MNDDQDVGQVLAKARKLLHDINQPLTVIMARSELLLLRLPAEDPHRRAIDQIHEQTEKLSTLIEELRSLIKGFQGE
ncbi:MAG: histidine kinase dimerization/phospho-acceptor domain-containing protein [Thermodesulfobacteriota bacterium]